MYTQKEALNIISKTAIGKDRAKILKNDDFRKLVLSTGANVTLYTCKIDENEQNPAKMLKNVYVGLILRKNKKGKFDGLGALGGLAERTNKDEFDKMSLEEKIKLVGNKDDVIMIGEVPSLIFDIDIIKKMFVHVVTVRVFIFGRQSDILIKIKGFCIGKIQLFFAVHSDKFGVNSFHRCSGC